MTISSVDNKALHTGNGSIVSFAYTYRMDNDDDMKVYLGDALQSSGYVVTRNGDNVGGTVDITPAPLNGVAVTLLRVVPLTQVVDYTAGDAFPAETHEKALDKLAMQAQQVNEEVSRAVSAPIGADPATDFTLPAYEAGKGLMWHATLKRLVVSNDNLNAVVGYAQTAESAANAASASESAAAASAAAAVVAKDLAELAAVSTAANVVTTGDDVTATNADVITTNAAVAQTALDVIATGNDVLAAAALLDSFDDAYLGSKASNPTLDNDGNPLADGALYYNTTSNFLMVYDLGTTTWFAFPSTSLAGLTDVTITSIAVGEILKWDGSGWINQTLAEAGVGGGFDSLQVFSADGTWIKPVGITKVLVYVTGGGGSGASGAATTNVGSGGGAGGSAVLLLDVSAIASVAVTVGVGGAGFSTLSTHGNAGGSSSFGAHCSATGGSGGRTTSGVDAYGGNGGAGSGGDINTKGGQGMGVINANRIGGVGGASMWGGGGANGLDDTTSTTAPGVGSKGSGGGGGCNTYSLKSEAAAGGDGIVHVLEYK